MNNPTVLFADEPTGNLDSATSAAVEDILFGLHRDDLRPENSRGTR